MKARLAVLIAGIALLAVVIPVQAHHPFNTEFDANKTVTLKGTVSKVEWANPHSTLYMDVREENGQTANWAFELGSPKKLKDFGWKKTTLKMGDQITVNAWRARDGSTKGSANMITLSDGSKLVGGSSFFEDRREGTPVSN